MAEKILSMFSVFRFSCILRNVRTIFIWLEESRGKGGECFPKCQRKTSKRQRLIMFESKIKWDILELRSASEVVKQEMLIMSRVKFHLAHFSGFTNPVSSINTMLGSYGTFSKELKRANSLGIPDGCPP